MNSLLLMLAAAAPAHDHSQMNPGAAAEAATPAPAHDHSQMDHTAAPAAETPAALPPPPVKADYADRFYDPAEMAKVRRQLQMEHGGIRTSMVSINLAEYAATGEGQGARWDVEGWSGSDLNRFAFATEGALAKDGALEEGELQLLYSRAIGPYFDLRGGARHDFGKGNSADHLAVGVQGLAPYWFEVEAMGFLSTRGEVSARFKASYDLRITQRIVVQPRVETNLGLSHKAAPGVSWGLAGVEAGLRVRYHFKREFAPYVGVEWRRTTPRSGEVSVAKECVDLVLGVRAWF